MVVVMGAEGSVNIAATSILPVEVRIRLGRKLFLLRKKMEAVNTSGDAGGERYPVVISFTESKLNHFSQLNRSELFLIHLSAYECG